MHYAKYSAPNLDDTWVDEMTGFTHYPDGSFEDLFGARYYPGDDLFAAFGFEELLDEDYLDAKL